MSHDKGEPEKGSEVRSMSDAMMNIREAAAMIGLRPKTVYDYCAREAIPFYRISARRLGFQRPELEAWLAKRRVPEAKGA